MNILFNYLKEEGIFGWNYKYLLTHPWVLFEESYRRTKWFFQRGWRGYADCDNWSIDGYLNSWMPEAIRKLKNGFGYPTDVYVELFPEDDFSLNNLAHSTIAHAKWHEILEDIALGFEAGQKICEYEFEGIKELNTLQAQLDKGLRLFGRYYLNLWD